MIGKDTRLSGYMIETALVAGFTSVGMDVLLLGPMPTPAVGMLTRSMRADLGVMISASHNPYEDNGIKLFDPDGYKLSDDTEREIETLAQERGVFANWERSIFKDKGLQRRNATTTTIVAVNETGTGDYLVPSESNGGSTLTVADWTGANPPPNDANTVFISSFQTTPAPPPPRPTPRPG